MSDASLRTSHSAKLSPETLCKECKIINGEALLKTKAFQWGLDYLLHSRDDDVSTSTAPGTFYALSLENPAASVKSCAACKLFHSVVHCGITLSEPTVLRLYLQQKRDLVEVEDVLKIKRERERAERAGETPNLDGKGTVSIFAKFGTIAAQEFPRRTIGQMGSDDSIACIRRWISECDSKHLTCRLGLVGDAIEVEPQMPTRVIDVTSFDGHQLPRLIDTRGLKGKYVAISHSWGTVVEPYTTTKNLASLKESIDFENMPKTFRDSVFIARKLGVQYVWIDSVCIIQDDYEDWKREAKTMGLVYEKAYLTISASDSSGDHAGFLTPNPSVEMDVSLPFQPGCPTSGHTYLRGQYTGVIDPRWTPISRRGWVLQERTLSRRILHFDSTQVHWECSQYRVSESGAIEDTTSNVNTSYFLGQNIKPLTGQNRGSGSSNHAERRKALRTLYHFYACKVHEFSDCKLTRSSDKLPAILGLGNEISRGTGIRCIEGHLFFEEPLFVYSLLWYTEMFSMEGSVIPDHVRAPSWSWAAMEGPRVFHLLGQDIEFERRIFLKIKSVLEVEALGSRPYSALVCFGRAIAGIKGDPSRPSNGFLGLVDHMPLHQDDEQFQPLKPPTFSYQILEAIDSKQHWPRRNVKGWVSFDSREFKPNDVFFIPVCAPLVGQEDTHPETTRGCLGLVVVKAHVSEQHEVSNITNSFKRVGFGGLYGTSWFDQRNEEEFILI